MSGLTVFPLPLPLQIDSMQALLHCPNVLVCVGREPFKPVSMENLRKHSVEKLPNLPPRSNNGNNVNENNESKKNLGAVSLGPTQPGDCRSPLCCPNAGISCGKCTSLSLPPRPFHPPLLFLWFPSRISSLHPLVFLLLAPHVWLTSLPLSYLWVSFSFQNSLLSCVCPPRLWRFPTNPLSLRCLSYHAYPPAFSCTRTRGCPGSASRRLSFSCRLQLAFSKQSVFLWKDYNQEGVCYGLFRIIFLWHPIMSYLRSQVIKPATLSSLGKETSQFQRAINLTCIKDLLWDEIKCALEMCLFLSIVNTRSLERFICVLPTSCRNSRTEASYAHYPRHKKKLEQNMGINWSSLSVKRLSKSISSIIRMVREELFNVIWMCSSSALPSLNALQSAAHPYAHGGTGLSGYMYKEFWTNTYLK